MVSFSSGKASTLPGNKKIGIFEKYVIESHRICALWTKPMPESKHQRSFSEIQAEIKRLQAELESRKETSKADLRKEFDLKLDESGLEITEIYPELAKTSRKRTLAAQKPRGEVAAKYRNPNGDETWSGRGRTPKWVQHILAEKDISLDAFKTMAEFTVQ